MKILQNLTLTGSTEHLKQYLKELPFVETGWQRSENQPAPVLIALIPPKEASLPDTTLYLVVQEAVGRCEVGNIVPKQGELSTEQYNSILQRFYADCVQNQAAAYHLTAILTNEEEFLEKHLSPHNMELLRRFSGLANRSTGAAHPADHKRWLDFISSSLRDGEIVDSGLLRLWLVTEGWPEDIAFDLVSQYDFGVALFKQIAQEEVESGASR